MKIIQESFGKELLRKMTSPVHTSDPGVPEDALEAIKKYYKILNAENYEATRCHISDLMVGLPASIRRKPKKFPQAKATLS